MATLTLRPEIAEKLPQATRERVAKLANWKLSSASRRAQRDFGWTGSQRRAAELAYRRFLALIAIDREGTFGMVQGPVDAVWHSHILDTMDYERMCREVFGSMVHHCPRDGSGKGQDGSAYKDKTLPALRRVFGVRAGRMWPVDAAADATSKCCGH
jgi:hypothetical protein